MLIDFHIVPFNLAFRCVVSVEYQSILHHASADRHDPARPHLNGREIFRDNMPTGLVAYTTICIIRYLRHESFCFLSGRADSCPASFAGRQRGGRRSSPPQRLQHHDGFQPELKGTLASLAVQIGKGSPGEFVLRWPSYPGKRYRVLYADALPAASWMNSGDILATGFSSATTNTILAGEQRFYRVQLLD